MGLSFFDVGGCNCPSCYPCALPATNLTASVSMLIGCVGGGVCSQFGPSTGSGTLTYSAISGGSQWTGAISLTGGIIGPFTPIIQCLNTGCTSLEITYTVARANGTNCSILPGTGLGYWSNPAGCYTNSGGAWSLSSFTCSPLSVAWNRTVVFSGCTTANFNLTVTP